MKTTQKLTAVLTLFSLASLVGCGGGGAQSAPTVTARPKPVAGGGNGGDSKTQGGTVTPKNGGGAGTFTGTITTDAKSTTGKPAGWVAKAFCQNPDIVKKTQDDSLVVGANGGLANAFVYLARKPAGYTPAKAEGEEKFTNIDCMFKPRVLIARVGQTVRVSNDDGVAHNTHTNPVIGTGFNQNVAPNGSATYKYDAAEPQPVKVNCDIHGWMFAYQLPLDHDLAAITDKDGKFTIKNLPAGNYKFNIWHEKAGYLQRNLTVVVGGGQTVEKNIKFEAAKFSSFNGPLPRTLTLRLK